MATSIIESAAHRRHDLSSVRVVSLGCAPIPRALIPGLAGAFPNARLVNMYELSEARYAGTALVYDGTRDGSVGRRRGATEIRITDEQGVPLPAGQIGEVRLRWRGLPPQHYFRDAVATSQVYVGGWTRTGDLGYLDGDGYLHLVDRLKDVIIKGGINIGSLEIENVLREHPAVADCSVLGVTDPLHGEEVACAVVLRSPASPGELRAFVGERLARHKIPRHVLELDELPRNRSGKVLKGELRAQLTRIAAPAPQSLTRR
jgi:acyl-CoA synthetase (AMP-forming)/AMP-acid ligase II